MLLDTSGPGLHILHGPQVFISLLVTQVPSEQMRQGLPQSATQVSVLPKSQHRPAAAHGSQRPSPLQVVHLGQAERHCPLKQHIPAAPQVTHSPPTQTLQAPQPPMGGHGNTGESGRLLAAGNETFCGGSVELAAAAVALAAVGGDGGTPAVAMGMPSLQPPPGGTVAPHAPQFARSLRMSAQPPPHATSPGGHGDAPARRSERGSRDAATAPSSATVPCRSTARREACSPSVRARRSNGCSMGMSIIQPVWPVNQLGGSSHNPFPAGLSGEG